jgi:hypothetical protein
MGVPSDVPGIDEIVVELRIIRERGLVRLRHTDLRNLSRAAARTGLAPAVGGGPGATEAVLRAAVENLGGGNLGGAASAAPPRRHSGSAAANGTWRPRIGDGAPRSYTA